MERPQTAPAVSATVPATARAFYGLFFLSGAGALVFENVWFSQSGLIVGNSVRAAALVTGAFMAGLALGNALAIQLARRVSDPVRAYAVLEVVAALSGAVLVAAFPFLPAVFRPLLAPFLDNAAALDALRLPIAFVLMAIPASALGATLPLLAKPLETLTGNYGYALGRLYGMNTLGALAGTLLAELFLIPLLGLRGSGYFAAACNLGAAAIAWRLVVQNSLLEKFNSTEEKTKAPATADRRRLLIAAFLAGGALLALEVIWFRFLLLFEDGTTLIFAVMLAMVLGGIGLGGLLASRLSRRGRLSEDVARFAAAGAAAALVASYAGFGLVASILAPVQTQFVLTTVILSAFLMGPVALASGVLFTALGDRLRRRMSDAGAATGALTLANTAGAMLGALLAAFLLLPFLGLERSFFLMAFAYGAIALVVPHGPAQAEVRWWRRRHALVALLALALFPFGRMAGTYYHGVEERFGGRLVAAREGIVQTTFYLSHDFLGEPLFLRLATNSYSMASTAIGGQRYMKLFAYLPAALHPRIERVLLVCFGMGSTASAIADLPDVKAIDVVDVSRDILEMSDLVYPDPPRHPLRDPRVKVHIEDGRFFLQQTTQRYDLITGEPPPPKMAGVASLYTREYFALMKDRLNPGGMATYWLPAYLLLEGEAMSVIRAFCDAFEDCSLWSGLNRDWILVGSRGGVAPVSRQNFSRLWALPAPRRELRRIGIDRPEQLVGQFMADAGALRGLTARDAPLEDNYPRRVRSALFAEPATPRYAWLMDAERGRERLETSDWAERVLPKALVRDSRLGFRRRGILDAASYPDLRRADYNFWSDVADVVRHSELVDLPRWLLGSGASVAEIAGRAGPSDPLAAEHLAINALATRQRPDAVVDRDRFLALTPKAQVVTIFHHCLAGQPIQARTLMDWTSADLRSEPSYRAFASWAETECVSVRPSREASS